LVKQFRYVGFLRDGKAATAFILQGQQVLTVAVGEVVAGRFQVTEVGEDFVVLASPAGDKQARLPLAGEAGATPRPQTPAVGVQPPAKPTGEQNNPGPLPETTRTFSYTGAHPGPTQSGAAVTTGAHSYEDRGVDARRGNDMKPSCVNSVRRLLVPVALGILLTGCGGLDFPIQKGEDLALQGRWEESVQVFREATKKDPQNTEARLGLARALWAASMEQVRLGEELEQSNRTEDAQTAYRRALGYNGENQPALVGLERIGRAGEIQDRLARARQRIAKKEWRAAQSEVQAVLRLDPDNAPARALKPEIAAGLTPDSLAAKAEADPGKLAQMLFSTKPVTLRFRDTDIKEVLETFSRTAGVNIFTD